MKCSLCGGNMKSREGKHGMFWYCHKNFSCRQVTVSDSLRTKSTSEGNRARFYGEKEEENIYE